MFFRKPKVEVEINLSCGEKESVAKKSPCEVVLKNTTLDGTVDKVRLKKNGEVVDEFRPSESLINTKDYVDVRVCFSGNYIHSDKLKEILIQKEREHSQYRKKYYDLYRFGRIYYDEDRFTRIRYKRLAKFQDANFIERKTERIEEYYTYTQIYENILDGKFHLVESREELDDYYSSDLRIEEWDSQKIYRYFNKNGFGNPVISYIQEIVHGDIDIFNYIKLMLDECMDKQEFLFVLLNIPKIDLQDIKYWFNKQQTLRIRMK